MTGIGRIQRKVLFDYWCFMQEVVVSYNRFLHCTFIMFSVAQVTVMIATGRYVLLYSRHFQFSSDLMYKK